MFETVISARGLSKRYRVAPGIDARRSPGGCLSEALARRLRRLSPLARGAPAGRPEDLWALRDVSFDIGRGEVVGIIGRNGAGKTTLLRILSRITWPTEGEARLLGRVGSLLDLGMGFHPELTGRENIYLGGAVLGLRKREIDRRFDEIVAFAEIDRFLQTPVKHYSAGMFLRLAFAVAAHLRTDILLVDEVLAVGDAAFQSRCLGRLEEVAAGGRTVLFVSHCLSMVTSLCSRAILLEGGRIAADGPPRETVAEHLRSVLRDSSLPLDGRPDRSGDGSVRLSSLRIRSLDPDEVIRPSSRLRIDIGYRSDAPVARAQFLVTISDPLGPGLFLLDSDAVGGVPDLLHPEGEVSCVTDPIRLTPGRCLVELELLKGCARADYVPHAGHFDVQDDDVLRRGRMPTRDWAVSLLRHRWTCGGGAVECGGLEPWNRPAAGRHGPVVRSVGCR